MPDFETLGKRAERELAAERDEELERLIYEDEQKLSGESPKKKRLRREIEAESLARMERLVLLCGHYEGVDERIIETLVDEEISIGDYVLTGGEHERLRPVAVAIAAGIKYMIRRNIWASGGCLGMLVRLALCPFIGLIYAPFMLWFAIRRLFFGKPAPGS